MNHDESIVAAYVDSHPGSAALAQQAHVYLAGGVNRDVVHMHPFPLYITRGEAGRVFDVDGNEYVDTIGGNGALLFGHGHPSISRRIKEQVDCGLHLGSCSSLEINWAQLVTQLIPSAKKVRFTNTGSEATHLALRLARAYTGKTEYVRLLGHFHGWHDGVAIGSNAAHPGADSAGVPDDIVNLVKLVDPKDRDALDQALGPNVAAIILEPSGGKAGLNEMPDGLHAWLRAICTARGIVLIFDEVISGFRWSSGGLQQLLGVTPDLTTLGKVLGGGFSCGAVAGRADILDLLSIQQPYIRANSRVHHGGTFSGNPIAAAAGITALDMLADGVVLRELNRVTSMLRDTLNTVLHAHKIDGRVHGDASVFHVRLGQTKDGVFTDAPLATYDALRMELANQGVLMRRFTGMLCAAHTPHDTDHIVSAFDQALAVLVHRNYVETAASPQTSRNA